MKCENILFKHDIPFVFQSDVATMSYTFACTYVFCPQHIPLLRFYGDTGWKAAPRSSIAATQPQTQSIVTADHGTGDGFNIHPKTFSHMPIWENPQQQTLCRYVNKIRVTTQSGVSNTGFMWCISTFTTLCYKQNQNSPIWRLRVCSLLFFHSWFLRLALLLQIVDIGPHAAPLQPPGYGIKDCESNRY